MLFTSLVFGLFLPIVFATYWLVYYPKQGCEVSPVRLWVQNLLVVVASYVFYGWWNWKFLLLIFFTSTWAYASGVLLDRTECPSRRKLMVALALVVNLGILGVFKYYNFFADNVVAVLNAFGFNAHLTSLQILLPVGISFYTFQALSYVIDVYRKDIVATKDLVAFLAFVSFFPQLVAGPIERATNLLPQFLKPRRFDYALAVEGCRQMLWGFFKKVLVADSCAYAANAILGNAHPSSVSLWIGMICFAFQIYGDFSGYSDIAIGCSKLFGVRLMQNFNKPYFSRDIAEFWRRWHISLTTWFRDYLYIPLGGSRCGIWKKVRNTFAIFLVSGFWHGANWTFVIWGFIHALLFLPLLMAGKFIKTGLFGWFLTFLSVMLAWVVFRAPDLQSALDYFAALFSPSLLTVPRQYLSMLPWIFVLLVVDWIQRGREHALQIGGLPKAVRWPIYFSLAVLCVAYQQRNAEFIYFQF